MEYKAVMPILGFDTITSWRLVAIDDIFYRLENKEGDGTPSFTLIGPETLRSDYAFDLPESAVNVLGLEKAEDAMVLNIMIVDTPLENSHINFAAPLVFNKKNGKMGQVVLENGKYPDYGVAEPLKKFLDAQRSAS